MPQARLTGVTVQAMIRRPRAWELIAGTPAAGQTRRICRRSCGTGRTCCDSGFTWTPPAGISTRTARPIWPRWSARPGTRTSSGSAIGGGHPDRTIDGEFEPEYEGVSFHYVVDDKEAVRENRKRAAGVGDRV